MRQDVRGRCKSRIHQVLRAAALSAAAFLYPSVTRATDIIGVMPASLDQPRVNAIIRYPVGNAGLSDPLHADFGGGIKTFNIQAFYDTGASGVLLSDQTATFLGLPGEEGVRRGTYNGQPVKFEDVGVVGTEVFDVSQNLHIQIGRFHDLANDEIAAAEEEFSNSGTLTDIPRIYPQSFGPVRTQIAPPPDNPLLEGLDVFGMPLMKGKVVVMDPKPTDEFFIQMRTYPYNPETPFNESQADSDPGIPRTTRSVKLSYGSFEQFTRVTPAGAEHLGPTLERNPFIGPNPVNPAGDPTPPVKLAYNGRTTTGSFLLDTGAAASMISTARAAALGVTVEEDANGPYLVGVPRDEQFSLTIGGVGGTREVPGFFLSSLLLPTTEGNAANDNDDKHIRFLEAPVLVNDITVKNLTNGNELTLDGIFGMNFLVASAFLPEGTPFPFPSLLTPGAFDWIVFDEPNGLLKLRPRVPGDANRDGTVDFEDLAALAQSYNREPGTNTPWNEGDFDGDGVIDFNDLALLAQHYNLSDLIPGDFLNLPHYELEFGSARPVAVPEPAATALAVAGIALGLTRRRR